MITAQIAPRPRLRARIAVDYIKGDIRLQSKTIIPSTERLIMKPTEGYGGFSSVIVEGIPYAQRVSFNSTPMTPDIIYGIESSWFSKLVRRVQIMAGTGKAMSPEDILDILALVKCYPQGYVETSFVMDFSYASSATGRKPIVPRIIVESTAITNCNIEITAHAVVLEEGV